MNKNSIYLLLIIFFLFSCYQTINFKGYCIYHHEYIINLNNSYMFEIDNNIKQILYEFKWLFLKEDNDIIYGFSDNNFKLYSLTKKNYIEKIILGDKIDRIIYSGYDENNKIIYYFKNNLLLEFNVNSRKITEIINLEPFFSKELNYIQDFYYDKKNLIAFIKFEKKTNENGRVILDDTIYKIDLKNNKKELIAQNKDKRLSFYKNYYYNLILFSNNEKIYEINNNKTKRLKIKNETRYNYEELSIDYIDQDNIIYRKVLFDPIKIISIFPISEKIEISIYNKKNNTIKKILYIKRSNQCESLNYFYDENIYRLLIDRKS